MDRQSLLEAFRTAIDREEEAAKLYTELAEQADDPDMKKLFHRFASEEMSHSDNLKDLYRAVKVSVPPGE